MNCQTCGNKVESDDAYCMHCGTRINNTQEKGEIADTKIKNIKSSKRPIGITILAILFFFTGSILFLFSIMVLPTDISIIFILIIALILIFISYGLWTLKWWARGAALAMISLFFIGTIARWILTNDSQGLNFFVKYSIWGAIAIIYLQQKTIKNIFRRTIE